MARKGQMRELKQVDWSVEGQTGEQDQDSQVAAWLAPRVAWQRRLLELSRSAERDLQPTNSLQPAVTGPSAGASITPLDRQSSASGHSRSGVTAAFERVVRVLGLSHPAHQEKQAA
jgi:hypothetical protein